MMDLLKIMRLTEKYHNDIDTFSTMVAYKHHLQKKLQRALTTDDLIKIRASIRNEGLIMKLIIILDSYQSALDEKESTYYALTKSACVILMELDLPEFGTSEGHLAFYNSYLEHRNRPEVEKLALYNEIRLRQ